jgi:hypothetical protein
LQAGTLEQRQRAVDQRLGLVCTALAQAHGADGLRQARRTVHKFDGSRCGLFHHAGVFPGDGVQAAHALRHLLQLGTLRGRGRGDATQGIRRAAHAVHQTVQHLSDILDPCHRGMHLLP